jgi:hypothetical protein
MPKQSEPEMRDVSDRDIHSSSDAGTKTVRNAEDDLVDPGEVSHAPHDRGHVNADGEYRDAVDEMYAKVQADLVAWRAGLTQKFPVGR